MSESEVLESVPGRAHSRASTENKLSSLPPFKPVAAKLLRLSCEEDVEPKAIATTVESDPAISAEVLRIANSPLFGLRSTIGSVGHAVTILGVDRIRNLAFTMSMGKSMKAQLKKPIVRQCWRHSLACGAWAEALAPLCGVSPSVAYATGLTHDIGRLGLLQAYSEEYVPLLEVEHASAEDSLSAEQALFGFDHCKAGEWLTRSWFLPADFSEVTARHHEPMTESGRSLVHVIQFSCVLADSLGLGAVRYQQAPSYEILISRLSDQLQRRLSLSMNELAETITQKVKMLE